VVEANLLVLDALGATRNVATRQCRILVIIIIFVIVIVVVIINIINDDYDNDRDGNNPAFSNSGSRACKRNLQMYR